jgi:Spy/CpxP family protein refolding chaperone
MRILNKLLAVALISFGFAGCAAPPPPPPPPMAAHHPAYLKAMSELRAARWLINHRPSDYQQTVDEIEATRQIDAGINDLRQAAYDDGKNPNDRPQVEEIIDPRGRLRAALDHLGRARSEIAREEDNAYASGLRDRSLGHVDAAINAVRHATVS